MLYFGVGEFINDLPKNSMLPVNWNTPYSASEVNRHRLSCAVLH